MLMGTLLRGSGAVRGGHLPLQRLLLLLPLLSLGSSRLSGLLMWMRVCLDRAAHTQEAHERCGLLGWRVSAGSEA